MALCHGLHEGRPQAAAGRFVRVARQTLEAGEQVFLLFGGNAGAGVPNVDVPVTCVG